MPRHVEKCGEDFLLEERRLEAERREHCGSRIASRDRLLQSGRQYVGRWGGHSVPPFSISPITLHSDGRKYGLRHIPRTLSPLGNAATSSRNLTSSFPAE